MPAHHPLPGLSRGLLLALALSHSWARYGAGPVPSIATVAAIVFLFQAAPVVRRPKRIGGVALAGLLLWDRFGQWPEIFSISQRLGLELLLETAGMALLVAAVRSRWPTMQGRGSWLLASIGLATLVSPWIPTLMLAALLWWGPSAPAMETPPKQGRIAPVVGAFGVLAVAAFWLPGRGLLDPTPSGFAAILLGTGLGLATGFGIPGAIFGVLLIGGMGLGVQRADEVTQWNLYGGLCVFGAGGMGLGWLLHGVGGRGARAGVGAAMVGTLLLPYVPEDGDRLGLSGTWWQAPSERETVAKIRGSRPLVYENSGRLGSMGLRTGRLSLEREGVLVDPAGRQGQAERFGGLLAGCVSHSHRRAMVLGDDLGLASLALRNQGFSGIDLAVPDRGLLAAQAQQMSLLQKLYLDPRLRLLPVPANFLKRFGDRPDVVVEILRHPWADGFTPPQYQLPPVDGPQIDGGEAPEVIEVLVVHLLDFDQASFSRLVADLGQRGSPVTLFLPPSGVDSAILVVSPQPVRWSDLESCAQNGAEDLQILGLNDAMDISALALAQDPRLGDPSFLDLPRLLLPPGLRSPPQLLLTALADQDVPPSLFLDAPPERAARVKTRSSLLKLLATSASGNVGAALDQARRLSEEPGGEMALAPLIQPYLAQARKAMEQQDWSTAESAISAAQGLFPGAADAWCLQGAMALARKMDAEPAFSTCLEKDPGRLEALDGLAQARQRAGNLPGTEKALRMAVSAHPEVMTTAFNLGWFLYTQDRPEEAERWLIQASARNAASPTPSPRPDLALARVYLQRNKAPLALAQAERSLSFQPTAEGLFLKGAAHYELNHLDLAEQAFSECLEADPSYYLAKGGLGQVQASRGQYKLAAQSFEAVLKADPQNQQARDNLTRLQSFLR